MIRVPVHVVAPLSAPLFVETSAQANISSVIEKARNELSPRLGLPQAYIAIAGRYVEQGQLRQGPLPNVSAEVFVTQHHGELTAALPEDFTSFPGQIRALKDEGAAQARRFEALESVCQQLTQENQQLKQEFQQQKQEFQQLTQRVTFLEADSESYQKVVLRHVVDAVHDKLQRLFGPKPEGETWRQYLRRLNCTDPMFLAKHELDLHVALLAKGNNTPFEEGNQAAHRPPNETVERIVTAADEGWRTLWKFASTA